MPLSFVELYRVTSSLGSSPRYAGARLCACLHFGHQMPRCDLIMEVDTMEQADFMTSKVVESTVS